MRELRTDKVAIPTRFARGAVVAVTCCVLIRRVQVQRLWRSPESQGSDYDDDNPSRLHQPTDTKPMTILDVGDSLGEDLGLGLGYTMARTRLCTSSRLRTVTVGSPAPTSTTGLRSWPLISPSTTRKW